VTPLRAEHAAPRETSAGEPLVACSHFRMDRYHLSGRLPVASAGRMSLWVALAGQAELAASDRSYGRLLGAGDCALVPASAVGLTWTSIGGPASLLAVTTAAS